MSPDEALDRLYAPACAVSASYRRYVNADDDGPELEQLRLAVTELEDAVEAVYGPTR